MSYRAVWNGMAAVLVLSIIIIVAIAAYATVASSKNESTYTSCAETTSTFARQGITMALYSSPCGHQISLSALSLTQVGNSGSLRGNVTVNSPTPLTGFIVYVNGEYELFDVLPGSNETNYSVQFSGTLSSSAVAIVSGQKYTLEFVGLFGDGTATTVTTQIVVA